MPPTATRAASGRPARRSSRPRPTFAFSADQHRQVASSSAATPSSMNDCKCLWTQSSQRAREAVLPPRKCGVTTVVRTLVASHSQQADADRRRASLTIDSPGGIAAPAQSPDRCLIPIESGCHRIVRSAAAFRTADSPRSAFGSQTSIKPQRRGKRRRGVRKPEHDAAVSGGAVAVTVGRAAARSGRRSLAVSGSRRPAQ